MYLPTMDDDLVAMIAALGWTDDELARAAFVDLGSGKGRAVLLAAMRGFREVVGVELSPVLHGIAEQNVATVRESGHLLAPVRLVLGDAADAELPAGPVVVYLYHPFRGEVARQVLDRVIASVEAAPRPAALLYCHPTLQPRIDPAELESRDVFAVHAAGARRTRHFEIGWTVLTNREWLAGWRATAV